ncbi:MAG TPA: cytochrome c [Vicinamibacterales bacterium]
MRTTIDLIALAVLIVTPPLVARSRGPVANVPGLQAPAGDTGDIAEGMRLYLQKGDCQSCHGWAADGRKMDSQMPDGSNLRETRLTRERLTQIIKCGRPGTGMPAFDKFAYTDGRCGLKQTDLKTPMPDPPATFQPREIDLLVGFLMEKVVGKGPMDRAKCIAYWGSEVDVCKEFK